jgi:hypothetical protein
MGPLMLRAFLSFAMVLVANSIVPESVEAGPYATAAGQLGSTAISRTDPSFVAWATSAASLTRGPQDINNPGGLLANSGTANDALGPAGSGIVSLGDGGVITLGFNSPIKNGSGFDFAVFENGFSDLFLELGFVEVSSDNNNFFRFPSVSLTTFATQVGSFGAIDPTNLHNLAGKYRANFGTPFDLEDLVGVSPLLNVNEVRFIRIVDVVGSINPNHATHDSWGNVVNDPYPTAFGTGGFDLDAVGVIHQVPEPAGWTLGLAALSILKWRNRRKSR